MRFEDFERVAEILFRINPALVLERYTTSMLIAHMQSFAYLLEREGHTFGGTFGYNISLFRSSVDREWIARATVGAHVIRTYLQGADGPRWGEPSGTTIATQPEN